MTARVMAIVVCMAGILLSTAAMALWRKKPARERNILNHIFGFVMLGYAVQRFFTNFCISFQKLRLQRLEKKFSAKKHTSFTSRGFILNPPLVKRDYGVMRIPLLIVLRVIVEVLLCFFVEYKKDSLKILGFS